MPQVRVIDESGGQLGIMNTEEALGLARQRGLDLVEVAESANPPVCKILDLGKYMYQLQKDERQQKSKRKIIEVKSVRLTPRISKHDMAMRARQAEKFLNDGNRVKIDMALRGREKALKNFANEKIREFLGILTVEYIVEKSPQNQPYGLSLIITKK